MYWIIIVALVIVAFLLLRMYHLKHKITLLLVVLFLLFLYISVSSVFSKYNVDLKSASGIERGAKIYFAWLGGAFGNMKDITANVARMDWKFENKTLGAEKTKTK